MHKQSSSFLRGVGMWVCFRRLCCSWRRVGYGSAFDGGKIVVDFDEGEQFKVGQFRELKLMEARGGKVEPKVLGWWLKRPSSD